MDYLNTTQTLRLIVFILLLFNSQLFAQRTRTQPSPFIDEKVVYCSQYNGATAAAQIAAAYAALPRTGGTVDCRGLAGAQALPSDPFAVMTIPTRIIFGAGTFTAGVNINVPRNVTLEFSPGSIISVDSGKIFTIEGNLHAPLVQIFSGTGRVAVASTGIGEVYPEWWGAVPDGKTDSTAAIQAAEDAIIGGGIKNTIQGAAAGIVKFATGTYYITQPISTCHFNNCPGGGAVPRGAVNACVTLRGDDRGVSVLRTDKNIDMIQMYSWSCPSVVENLYIASSAVSVGVRIRGNQTTLRRNWLLSNIGVIIEATSTIDTAGTILTENQCDATQIGGPGGCIQVTRSGGTGLSPNNIQIVNQHCYGGAWCLLTDHIWDSRIDGMTGNGPGTYFMSISGAIRLAISNVTAVGGNVNNQPSEDGIELINSSGVTINNFIASSFPGPALNVQSSSVFISNVAFSDNVQNARTRFPYEVYGSNSDLVIKGGRLSNTTGNPVNAIYLTGNGPAGSYDIDGLIISGSKYSATVVVGVAGAGGMYRVNLSNNEFRDVNATGGATPTIMIGATLSLVVANNKLKHLVPPNHWLSSTFAFTNSCLWGNISDGGNVSLNGSSFGGFTTGCFNGANQLSNGEFNTINTNGLATVGMLQVSGGTPSVGAGYLSLGSVTVAALGPAAGHDGQLIHVTDSRPITVEGQVCVGGGSTKALAYSDGVTWKCF
jgi:hypothetical protein